MEFEEQQVLRVMPQDGAEGYNIPTNARLWEAATDDGGTVRVGLSKAPNGMRFVQVGYLPHELGIVLDHEVTPPPGAGDRFPTFEEVIEALAVAVEPEVLFTLGLISNPPVDGVLAAGTVRVLMLTEVGRTGNWRPPDLVAM